MDNASNDDKDGELIRGDDDAVDVVDAVVEAVDDVVDTLARV